ncbi:MAG: hypothetical protein KDA93_14260 [Planctomycetaceae bacterium]|nr:hypothetical protein [Planctomycetaceae bacterium]
MTDDNLTDDSPAPLTLRDDLRTNKWWGAVVLSGIAFVVTCFAAVVSPMGDPQSPMNTMITQHGIKIFLIEAAALISSCLIAMAVDRRQTLRQQQGERNETETP